jgi:prepilin-type N-terminal cleavage/methylation domain-containing protein
MVSVIQGFLVSGRALRARVQHSHLAGPDAGRGGCGCGFRGEAPHQKTEIRNQEPDHRPAARRPAADRQGFTLIELLVVITIIMILAGLVLTAANMITSASKRTQTETIFTAIHQGLRLTLAERGSLPQPAEHPLAGSLPPRPVFLRSGSIASGGEALVGVSAAQVIPAVRPRLLLPEDRYGDTDLPLLYGLERAAIGVLGARRSDVTRFRWLAVPTGASVVPDRNGDGDYTTLDYPDPVHLVAPTTTAADSRDLITYALGASALDECAKLGGLHEAADTGTILGGRLWSEQAGRSELDYDAGRVHDGSQGWKDYRLPGLALVDAWGREILYRLHDGQIGLASAGEDGVFAIDPGDDLVYDPGTDALSGRLAGDDRDGRHDNVQLGQAP